MKKIFISYAHEDESLKIKLQKHLSALKRNKQIDPWEDRMISPGDNWKDAIYSELIEANIILLLISPDFLSSDYCYEIEMKTAMTMHEEGRAIVVPIILRHCDWKDTPFAKLQGLPKHGKPVTDWEDADEAFLNIIEGIKKLLNKATKIEGVQEHNAQLTDIKRHEPITFNTIKKAIRVFEKDKNIFAVFEGDNIKQITFSKADRDPLLMSTENTVVFIRDTFGDRNNHSVEKIMKVDYHTLFEQTVTNMKPYKGGLISTYFIHEASNPTISLDEKYIYFLADAYVTSANLVRVNLITGEWQIISDAVHFKLIKNGPYHNLILIGKAQIKTKGRDVYYYLINEKNEILKEFESRENFDAFKNYLETEIKSA